MARVAFYHLQRQSLGEALPKLLVRALAAGHRIIVKTGGEAETESLNKLLWVYDPDSFLPHGSKRDGWEAEQPIYLTESDENPNAADLLCQVGGAEAGSFDGLVRVLDLFDGKDPDAVAAARDRWRRYRDQGHEISYWQQKDGGGWEQKA